MGGKNLRELLIESYNTIQKPDLQEVPDFEMFRKAGILRYNSEAPVCPLAKANS